MNGKADERQGERKNTGKSRYHVTSDIVIDLYRNKFMSKMIT